MTADLSAKIRTVIARLEVASEYFDWLGLELRMSEDFKECELGQTILDISHTMISDHTESWVIVKSLLNEMLCVKEKSCP